MLFNVVIFRGKKTKSREKKTERKKTLVQKDIVNSSSLSVSRETMPRLVIIWSNEKDTLPSAFFTNPLTNLNTLDMYEHTR